MALGPYDSRAATVRCPIYSTCGTRIFKDRASYAAHMVNVHGATDTEFADVGVRGVGGYDRTLALNGVGPPVRFREDEVLLWCGCGSTSSCLGNHVFNHLGVAHGVDVGEP